MRKLTATICLTLAVLLGSAGVSFALPPCPSDQNQYYDNCFGTSTFTGGNKYVGEYRNGKPNGQGTFTWVSGNKYVGEFRDGKMEGQGTFTWVNRAKYVGKFTGGKRNGHFTVTFANGNKYVGEYRDGKRNGQGTFTFASGRIKEGIWKDNKFQYAQKGTPPVIARRKLRSTPQRRSDPNKVISASSGSGFAVSSNGHVITNHHVIEGCQKVKIHHKGKSFPATVITFDPRNDLALLNGNFRPSTVLPLSTNKPELLQDVYVAGYPFGRKVSTGVKVTKGIISSLTGIGNNFSNIQIDAALQPGNSGGPILDDRGNVVGVAVARLNKIKILKKFGSFPENTNFGIKASVVRTILESSNVSTPSANRASISKTKLGKMISDGTYYLSCWMTRAQIKKMRSKKVIFQNLD
ncbi:MAG: S1-C subfamily serine protease [Alphaproteobacteria bacterium]|jgi:S1-C subfamily serine protease